MEASNEIKLDLNESGRGGFFVENDGKQMAKMEIAVKDSNLTVFHTEVDPSLKGAGIGTKLLATMVDYARQHQLKVIPLCPFVHAQFKKNPDKYGDIWNQSWHRKPH